VSAILHMVSKERVAADSFLTVAVDVHVGQAPSLKYLSRRNPFKPVKLASPLADVAALLGAHERLHRVPVVGEDGKCVRIVSQSAILKFIADHRDEAALDIAQTLEGINLGLKSVITVAASNSAKEAFGVIEKANLSGIGVVDEEGKLIANTSAQDIKAIVLDRGQLSLEEPVMDYLSAIRQIKVEAKERAPVSVVHKNDSLGRVIGLLASTHYHRIFIIDERGAPIGVVSISDVLAYATQSASAAYIPSPIASPGLSPVVPPAASK